MGTLILIILVGIVAFATFLYFMIKNTGNYSCPKCGFKNSGYAGMINKGTFLKGEQNKYGQEKTKQVQIHEFLCSHCGHRWGKSSPF